MSESQMQQGWYYAQGDPPGTQRYWDGTQWVGDLQYVDQAAGGAVSSAAGGTPAEWVERFVAVIIDIAILIGIVLVLGILAAVLGSVSDTLGGILFAVTALVYFGFVIWNSIFRQGKTGQTLGKSSRNIKLVSDATGQPVGALMAFVRMIVAWALSTFTFGIGGLLDLLWPLWDAEKKRLTDKILKFSVIKS